MTLYRPATDPKYQRGEEPVPEGLADEVVVSEDTRRDCRLPEGQHRTRKWPVLHATHVPKIDQAGWRLSIEGLVEKPLSLSLEEFRGLPRLKVFADFHCVTKWSRLGNVWEGVRVRDLLHAAGISTEAGFAIIGAFDDGWTTNLPLRYLLDDDVLLADVHDGMALDADHGGPVRLVVPRLFAWKSAKWVNSIRLVADDCPGYWEQAGYHNVGDPWQNQRFRDDPEWLAQQKSGRRK